MKRPLLTLAATVGIALTQPMQAFAVTAYVVNTAPPAVVVGPVSPAVAVYPRVVVPAYPSVHVAVPTVVYTPPPVPKVVIHTVPPPRRKVVVYTAPPSRIVYVGVLRRPVYVPYR